MDAEEIKDKAVYVLKSALNQGAEDVIVNILVDKTHQVKFANNDIASTKTWDSVNMHVFLTLKKRIVSTLISDLSNRNVDESIRNLIKFAKSLKPSVDYHGIAEGPFNYGGVAGSCDKKIAGLSTENIDYVECAINNALNYAKRTAGVLYTTHLKDYLISSNNIEASYERTNIEISLRAFTDKNASGHGVSCATNLRDFNPGEAGKKAGEIAKQALNPVEGKEGVYDIIFDPLAFANLLGHILGFASAFSVDIGESFLADRIDKVIGSDIVTLVDDGSLAGGFNSSKFDAEGVPTQRNVVVEKGILKTYLHNTSTAKKYGVESTANAGLISPHPWNAVVEPGDYGRDELFSGVNKGLYITNVWYTRFQNYRTGDFSTIPRDGLFLIENGELSRSLSNLRVSDNLLTVLKNITALGDKREWIHWWDAEVPSLLPYVLVKDVRVTKPED